jgi:serine/threonine protein kinase
MLAINQILQERYRIVRQLGHGGMGAVYEAIDERFGTPVALKEILIELSNSASEKPKDLKMEAFEREAKSLAQARHEAIPYVRDYFSELNRQFLVMELVEGDDLAELLEKRGKPFPFEDIIHWADQLLDALDYLHNLKPPIIHRDIKPQNLKLSFRRKIKLLDFGIAKSGDRTSTINNKTFVGATLNYSPIEQILRVINPTFREFIILKHKEEAEKILNQDTDSRCDIYALGATFYHLLTNRLPIDSTKRTLEIWEGKADPLPNPSELNPGIPLSISGCLLKAMEVERGNRFSSAIEMQTALQTLMAEARSGKRDAEKTLPLTEPFAEEERNLQEHQLMKAKTERLITGSEEKAQTENDFIAEIQPAPIQPLATSPSDTPTSAVETFVTESSLVEVSNTQPSGSIIKSELTGTSYFDESLIDSKETTPEPLPIFPQKSESKSDAKLFWILPIAAVSIFAVGGIGGMVWWSDSNSTDSNKPAVNAVIATPTATATISPIVSPSASPIPSATPDNTDKSGEKPTVLPTPNKTPMQNPEKTPSIQKTPKTKPQKQNTSDDCIYNGKCN